MLIHRDAATTLQVRLDGNTVWLSQRQISELYQVSAPTVSEHLNALYEEGEVEAATLRKLRTVQTEGSREVARSIDHYSLDSRPSWSSAIASAMRSRDILATGENIDMDQYH